MNSVARGDTRSRSGLASRLFLGGALAVSSFAVGGCGLIVADFLYHEAKRAEPQNNPPTYIRRPLYEPVATPPPGTQVNPKENRMVAIQEYAEREGLYVTNSFNVVKDFFTPFSGQVLKCHERFAADETVYALFRVEPSGGTRVAFVDSATSKVLQSKDYPNPNNQSGFNGVGLEVKDILQHYEGPSGNSASVDVTASNLRTGKCFAKKTIVVTKP